MIFALAFGAGTVLCQYLLPEGWWVWTAAAALPLGVGLSRLWRGRRRRAAVIAAFGLALGMAWFAGYAALYLSPAEELVGQQETVTVELLDYAEKSNYGSRCTVRVLGRGLRGRAVYYGSYELLDLEPGSWVTASATYDSAGTIRGEGSTYYTSQGVFLRLYGRGGEDVSPGHAGELRFLPQRMARRLKEAVGRLYGDPARGFITALLTGERDGLDQQSYSDLSEAGLMHITAVSGLHCGFLIALLGLLVLRRQRLTALLGYPVLLFYMVMVGCTPSVVRSCVMVGLALLAPLLGREGDAPTSLSAALLAILLANPFAVASVSLQLSFAAVAGLLLPAPRVYAALDAHRPKVKAGKWAGKAWSFLAGTLSASVGVMVFTAPLSAAYFGTLSLVSPLSNLMVLWMAPVLFAGAMVVTVLGAFLPAAGALAFVPDLLARYVLWAAGTLAKLPGHSVRFNGQAAVLWLVLVYVLLGACLLSKDGGRKYVFAAVAAAVTLAAVRALPMMIVKGDALTVVAVDVGQGAGTLLHSGDVTALVDCGSLNAGDGPGAAVADAMYTYGWKKLDYVGLTHYHEDHAGGLAELLARVEVDQLLLPQLLDDDSQGELQKEVLALAERYGAAVTYVEEPSELALGEASLTVYPPLTAGDTNERGLTFLCTSGRFDLLITGDMNGKTEGLLVEAHDLPDIEVLMAGHHGSKYSTSEELLDAVTPEVGVISVGENSFGHPTPEAMGRMARAGMTIYRTDLQGNILIRVHSFS